MDLDPHKDIEGFLRELYAKLFALPKSITLVILYVAGNITILLTGLLITKDPIIALKVFIAAVVYISLILLTYRRIGEVRVDIKRILGIAFFSIIPYSLASLLMLLPVPNRDVLALYAASSAMLFLIRFIFWGNIFSSFGIGVFIGVATSFTASLNYVWEKLLTYLMTSVSTSLAMLIFISLLEILGRSNGIKPFELGRGFIRSWMFDDHSSLEDTLEKDSIKRDVSIKTIIFNREDRDNVIWVFPGFHFGPFRRVGSSDAVYVLEEALGDVGKTMVFHTLGSHERNIVKRKYVREISEEFAKELRDYIRENKSVNNMYMINLRGLDGWGSYVVGSEKCYSYILYNLSGADDIQIDAEDFLKKLHGSETLVAVADAHSNYSRRSVNYSALKRLLVEINDRSDHREEILRIGFGEAFTRSNCGGLCSGLVKSMIIETSGGRDALIYLYGNNMLRSANERVREIVMKKGFRDVIIITPDDHSCAATSVGDPYTAVKYCSDLMDAILESLDKATKDLSPARIMCYEKIFRDIPLMGEAVWNYIRGLEVLGPLTPRLWIIFLLVSIGISLII
ncbi:MAG: DUF2070 family protein [Sulfolobales archaeon]